MDADPTADAVRKRSFSAALRGYDRTEVDRFREEMATRIGELESQLSDAGARLRQLGIDDVPLLSDELAKVGADIDSILEEARRTATDMRERARRDADEWRSAAEAAAAAMRTEAQEVAEQLRGHAWREGTDLLDLAQEEAERLVAAGRQDVLFIRAEAEREVLRLTGEARREAEDLLRNARAEADRLVADADAEAGQIVQEAQRSVQGALERTRTLEARRAELLEEIDSTRLTLEAMQRGTVEAQRVVRPGQEPPELEWPEDQDDGAVKIVAPTPQLISGPIDADELVAEVEQLRSARPEPEPEPPPEVEPEPVPELEPVPEPEPAADLELEPTAQPEREPAPKPELEPAPESEPAARPEREPAPKPEPAADLESEAAAQPEREPAPEPEPDEENEALAGLFAQLRTPTEPAPIEEPAAAAGDRDPGTTVPAPEPPVPPRVATSGPAGEGAFELRDRLLLPIENRALRSVKRHLVELQSHVLEELRTARGKWSPDPDEFLAEMSDDIVLMRQEAHAAGGVAAGELTGRTSIDVTAPPGNPATREFAESLIAAVAAAHERAVRDEAGARELASAVSRVFRAWRTDEAERRLRSASYRAYHEGLVAGFAAAGVAAVTAVTTGRPCAECPAGAEWAPGGDLPAGCEMPPAHVECSTTVVPAGMAG